MRARAQWVSSGVLDDAGTWVLHGDPRRRRSRSERQRQRLGILEELSFGAEMMAICGLVIAQPVLDVFARSPEWFAYREATSRDIVTFALAVIFVPPLVLWGVIAPTRLVSRPLRRGIHLVTLGGLVALLLVQGLRTTFDWNPTLLVVVAFGLGALVAVLYPAVRALRSWMLALSVMPLVFGALFLGNSATGALVFASHDVELAASRSDSPVVILILDEFPTASLINSEGEVDPVRYPNLARFSQDATWYRNFTSQAGGTVNAVPAILSGREAVEKSPFWFEYPNNLFTLLGASHKLYVWEVMTQLCAPSLCRDGGVAEARSRTATNVVQSLLGDASDVWQTLIRPDDEVDPMELFGENQLAADSSQVDLVEEAVEQSDEPRPWSELSGEIKTVSQPGRFADFLDAIGTAEEQGTPGLYLAHILLPHQPWRFLPDGTSYVDPGINLVTENLVQDESAPWHTRVQRQRHLMQTQYADGLVGDMLDRLDEVGLYDEALVMVVADHGVGFTAGEGLRIFSGENYPELMWAPLFVKGPGQRDGQRTDVNAQLPDVLPTLAGLLGVEIPWKVDGVSLAGATAEDVADGTKRYHWFEDVNMRDRDLFEVDAAKGLAEMLALAPDPAGGPADWVGPLYSGHPHASLVGKEVSSLAVGSASTPTARIDSLDEVLESDPLPHVNIVGELRGLRSAERPDVAVALNGRIVGVSPTERLDGSTHLFQVLAHPAQFVRGRQDLRVYLISDGDDSSPMLLELELGSR